jgi:hypothetical protein
LHYGSAHHCLAALHDLDPSKPLSEFCAGLVNGLARDPLLLATTTHAIGMPQGELLLHSEMAKQRLQGPEPAYFSYWANMAFRALLVVKMRCCCTQRPMCQRLPASTAF